MTTIGIHPPKYPHHHHPNISLPSLNLADNQFPSHNTTHCTNIVLTPIISSGGTDKPCRARWAQNEGDGKKQKQNNKKKTSPIKQFLPSTFVLRANQEEMRATNFQRAMARNERPTPTLARALCNADRSDRACDLLTRIQSPNEVISVRELRQKERGKGNKRALLLIFVHAT